jgi:hypothetical protein
MFAGEFQGNVLIMNKGVSAFFSAILVYVFFLSFMYLFGKFLERKISSEKFNLVYYLFGGLLGLAIEWFVIGNSPWLHKEAIQAGMFAWWGAIFFVPIIFTTTDALTSVKKRTSITLLIYSVVSTIIISLMPINIRAGVFAILLAIFYIILNFQFVPFITRGNYGKIFTKLFMWFLVLATIIQLIIFK